MQAWARARGISCCLCNSVLAAESRGFLRNPWQVPAPNPLSRPQVVPGGGSSDVYISFTPLVLPDTEAEQRCEGMLLGFMSLDDKVKTDCHTRPKVTGNSVSLPVIYVQPAVTWPVCVNSPVPAILYILPKPGLFICCISLWAWKHSGVGMSPSSCIVQGSRPQTKAQGLKCYHNIRFYW